MPSLCVIRILVVSPSSDSILPIICSVYWSTDEVGSSNNSTFVFFNRARINEILCFSPPEKMLPFYPTFSLYLFGSFYIISWRFSRFVSSITSQSLPLGLPNLRFYMTVPLKRQGCCDTKVMCFLKLKFKLFKSLPSISMLPSLGSQSRKMRLRIVVFPMPLLPVMATKELGCTVKFKPSNTLLESLIYRKDTFLNTICPCMAYKFYCPSVTEDGMAIIEPIFLMSMRLSSNMRYMAPRLNRGPRN